LSNYKTFGDLKNYKEEKNKTLMVLPLRETIVSILVQSPSAFWELYKLIVYIRISIFGTIINTKG
jgi:hypothetical protein